MQKAAKENATKLNGKASVANGNAEVHFKIYLDRVGEYKWKLLSENNEVISRSEGHVSKLECIRSIQAVQKINGKTRIEDV